MLAAMTESNNAQDLVTHSDRSFADERNELTGRSAAMTIPAAIKTDTQLHCHVEEAFQIASVLQNEGRFSEADRLYQFILAVMPTHYASLFRLGTLRSRTNQMDDAVDLLGRAVAAKPDSVPALGLLGIVLSTLNRDDEAIACYERALAINPEHTVVLYSFGAALQRRGQSEQGILQLERAVAINPDYAVAHFALANILHGRDRLSEAIVHYEKVLTLQPRNDAAHNDLAVAFQALGRIEDAGQAYERALEHAPRNCGAHFNLAHLRRFTTGDRRLVALEKLAEDIATLDTKDQISLHFSLGKAFGDLAQHERSFRHLRDGNALKRAQLTYDEDDVLSLFKRIRTTFTPELMRQQSGGGCHSDVPVFVVGMPRSGTTLVEQILASHSKVHGAGEIETFHQAMEKFGLRNGTAAKFPDFIPAMSPDALHDLGCDYIELTKSAVPDAERIVNKVTLNFQYVGLIHLTLPDARIIHIRRDPLDTCFSCFSLLFADSSLPFTYDLGELGHYYRGYAAVMEHWRNVLPPGVMIEVQYEDLIDDIEGQARAIADCCGLPWEDACLAFHESRRPVRTASSVQVRERLYRTSIGRWRPYAAFLQPLIEALNSAAPGNVVEALQQGGEAEFFAGS
jgi:tetratricopeptide (TPR) repeat protein